MGRGDGPCSCGVAVGAGARQAGPNDSAVVPVSDPFNEAFGFEPIDELRDVGTDAATAVRELAQRQRLACSSQMLQHAVLGQREADGVQGRFESPLRDRGRMN